MVTGTRPPDRDCRSSCRRGSLALVHRLLVRALEGDLTFVIQQQYDRFLQLRYASLQLRPKALCSDTGEYGEQNAHRALGRRARRPSARTAVIRGEGHPENTLEPRRGRHYPRPAVPGREGLLTHQVF